MKNNNFFPFERNRYFYGKLLSVDDFELEQNYMNNKRRVLNRMLYGYGVVAGLDVVVVGDKEISLEAGMAIDYSGREILVDSPIHVELSKVDGFDSYADAGRDYGFLYLCIEYDECKQEAVHNIAGGAHATDAREYNKYREGYRLYLTDQEPNERFLSFGEDYEEVGVVYEGQGVRVKQSLPRYGVTGETLPLRIRVEKVGQQRNVAFSYNLELNGLSYKDHYRMKVSFNEHLFESCDHYEQTYELKAVEADGGEAGVAIGGDGFRMSLEGSEIVEKVEGCVRTSLVKWEEFAKMEKLQQYGGLEVAWKNAMPIDVYLSKIILVRAGDSYSIQSLRNVPFEQFIKKSNVNYNLNQRLFWEIRTLKEELRRGKGASKDAGGADEAGEAPLMEDGVVEIPFRDVTKKGQRYFSDEIPHGLGMGPVSVVLGFCGNEEEAVYGSAEVFDEMESFAEVAAKVDEARGTIRIGVRLLQATYLSKCKVRYTVSKSRTNGRQREAERKIFIRPNVLKLKVGESYYLQAVCDNMEDERIYWSVKEDSGTMEQSGKYTAPNRQGIYEVTARSVAHPECVASILVIVKGYEK